MKEREQQVAGDAGSGDGAEHELEHHARAAQRAYTTIRPKNPMPMSK